MSNSWDLATREPFVRNLIADVTEEVLALRFGGEKLREHERVRAGLAEARLKGTRLGRPRINDSFSTEVGKLHRAGVSTAEIARRLNLPRTSVRHLLPRARQPGTSRCYLRMLAEGSH